MAWKESAEGVLSQTEDGIPPLPVRQLFEVGEGGYIGAPCHKEVTLCIVERSTPQLLSTAAQSKLLMVPEVLTYSTCGWLPH